VVVVEDRPSVGEELGKAEVNIESEVSFTAYVENCLLKPPIAVI